ncbi:hypothetical protein A2767_05515 [Candidatus Roizmanbacteria bacterium RIFCSPHIGHO2_01_FULL_35_10]|uniref:Fido domain-containing protein n=1 Tax=Candidatus Roizmanbacteria bacterium RIFCSPLOWO2_01_FULL_35_13 TaxID=1802055 RepID=A0A1F7IBM4_9BACT|nr:MAG: hypothetical protein A2767_05515 [Candidatus Roizmanbacteria bacterium RIFCSPHIGHO2_01_FULL_35_10]OGK40750.1 MAG: hypothetical protein A3A74_03985 [Candidatus Roizmanbacteria bacterium RIFCSPLOWO2_01_FULL_35_13]
MRTIIYLTLEQILLIHEDQIDKYGGSHGIRDFALLESAILRPQTTFGGVDLYPSIFDKAASLIHSLLLNHPFVDGNKRNAIASALVFLELNGYSFSTTQDNLVSTALSIENKKWNLEKISSWLKKHSKKLDE